MGYTHYLTQMNDCPATKWAKILAATQKLIPKLPKQVDKEPLLLANWSGDYGTQPVFDDKEISFNGTSKNEDDDLGHESFRINRVMPDKTKDQPWRAKEPGFFAFCKTARKPYDIAVTAVLLIAHNEAPGIWDIGSDGDLEEWMPAIKLYHKVFGTAPELPGCIDPAKAIARYENMFQGKNENGIEDEWSSSYKGAAWIPKKIATYKAMAKKIADMKAGNAPALSKDVCTGLEPALK